MELLTYWMTGVWLAGDRRGRADAARDPAGEAAKGEEGAPGGEPTRVRRRWDRCLHHYPERRTRAGHLLVVALSSVVLYSQQYVGGSVAPSVLGHFQISFRCYLTVVVVSSVTGAVAFLVVPYVITSVTPVVIYGPRLAAIRAVHPAPIAALRAVDPATLPAGIPAAWTRPPPRPGGRPTAGRRAPPRGRHRAGGRWPEGPTPGPGRPAAPPRPRGPRHRDGAPPVVDSGPGRPGDPHRPGVEAHRHVEGEHDLARRDEEHGGRRGVGAQELGVGGGGAGQHRPDHEGHGGTGDQPGPRPPPRGHRVRRRSCVERTTGFEPATLTLAR